MLVLSHLQKMVAEAYVLSSSGGMERDRRAVQKVPLCVRHQNKGR